MGVRSVAVAVAVAATVVVVPSSAVADGRPAGPNPFLSLLPDGSTVNYAGWRRYLAQRSAVRPGLRPAGSPVQVAELEPPGMLGFNDTLEFAEPVPGFGTGPESNPEGRISGELSPQWSTPDIDVYRVELSAGDVFAAQVTGGARRVTIVDPAGVEVQGSAQDLSFIFPAASPLPRGGNAIADHVAGVSGPHYVAVSGAGGYEIAIMALRPPLEREPLPQTIFLDFDGAEIDMRIFEVPGSHRLSPLRAFLSNWGLTAVDEPAVIRRVTETVWENLAVGDARVTIQNSLDDPDTFGTENVSRVVIGGTRSEAGLNTVGIAQSIDPGNFAHEETALVLLDDISQPAGPDISLNNYLAPHSDRVAFVGQAIGNLVTHEIGHYLGNWHTQPGNGTINLMDAGGGWLGGFFGVGTDNIGGTADDTDTDFTTDTYSQREGFTGEIDSRNRTTHGLSSLRPQP